MAFFYVVGLIHHVAFFVLCLLCEIIFLKISDVNTSQMATLTDLVTTAELQCTNCVLWQKNSRQTVLVQGVRLLYHWLSLPWLCVSPTELNTVYLNCISTLQQQKYSIIHAIYSTTCYLRLGHLSLSVFPHLFTVHNYSTYITTTTTRRMSYHYTPPFMKDTLSGSGKFLIFVIHVL